MTGSSGKRESFVTEKDSGNLRNIEKILKEIENWRKIVRKWRNWDGNTIFTNRIWNMVICINRRWEKSPQGMWWDWEGQYQDNYGRIKERYREMEKRA